MPPTDAELAAGQPILEVRFDGNERVTPEELDGMIRWMKVGKLFNPKGVTRDVRELWDSGYFDGIEVDLTRRDEGVKLRVIVQERPSIKEITYSGNHKLDEDDLNGIVHAEVKLGSIINHAALRRAVQKIRDKYAEDGFFLAEARYEVVPQKDNQVSVRVTIREYEKVTVRHITFIGNHDVSDDDLRASMLTGKGGFFDFGRGGPFRQDAFERDVLVLTSLYYDRGYLGVQISAPRVLLTPDRTGIDIVITVDEGPRFKIRRLSVIETDSDGREVEPLGGHRTVRDMVRARPGEWYNAAELAKDIAGIQTMYRDAGFAHVEARPQSQVYPEQQRVDIIVRVQRRGPVRFGRIEIKGNTKTRDRVIRREMEIKEGALFSETRLAASRLRIAQLGYFQRVDLQTAQGDDPDHINVMVDVIEKPTGTFQIGAGFSSIESFIATAQVQQQNLFGNGQALSLQAQVSGLKQLIEIHLYEPYLFDSPFSANVEAFDQVRSYSQFSVESRGGSLTFGYPLIDNKLFASLGYTLKDDAIDTRTTTTLFGTAAAVSVFQRLPLANLFNDGLTSSFRPSLTYDTRNDRIFPSEGVYLQASSEIALRQFGSDNEYIKNRLLARFYYPVTTDVVLKFNAEAGLVTSPGTDGVPLFARFFLGGIFDLRGYRLRTVGPRLPLKRSLDENAPFYANGANVGGNMQYFQNLELEFPIVQPVGLRGVVFTDLGNAWNLEGVYCDAASASLHDVTNPCFKAADIFNVRTSVGFGLRWISPLGPLRFEWGFPLKPLPYEETSVFEFTIGNFF
ncbi:MAG: outer membrane protein assembly factor BamA [Myxococcales bacterium]|nr:outer membrane protein assembly factor BamA [Myxococcales bacterium]